MTKHNSNIENMLKDLKAPVSRRLEKSASLSVSEKNSLFTRITQDIESGAYKHNIKSPFVNIKNPFDVLFKTKLQYAFYVLPIVLLGVFVNYSHVFWANFSQVAGEVASSESSIQAKMSLSKAQREIYALKAVTDSETKKDILVAQLSNRSREVRNRVAALVKENKITEAKEIVLDLETALKADQLYTVSPVVVEEVLAATDLRLKLEKKEVVKLAIEPEDDIASSTPETVKKKISALYTELDSFKVTDDKKELVDTAKAALKKSEDYLASSDLERAVITLQAAERTVAELRVSLVQ